MSRSQSLPQEPVTAAMLASILANRRIHDKAGYVAKLIRDHDLAREDMAAIHAMIERLIEELRLEIASREGRSNAHLRRRMSHCSVLLGVLAITGTWLSLDAEKLLKDCMEAVTLAGEATDHGAEIRALVAQGNLLSRLGRCAEALDVQRRALRLSRRYGTPENRIYSLMSIAALLHFKLNRSEEALEAVEEATTLVALHASLGHWAAPPIELHGLIMRRLGHIEEGLQMLEAAQKITVDLNLPVMELRIQVEIMNLLDDLGEYPMALENARRVETLLSAVPHLSGMAGMYCTIGRLLIKLNELDAARQRLDEALRITEGLKSTNHHFNIRYQLGLLHLAEGDAPRAEERFVEALDLAVGLGLPVQSRAKVLASIGRALAAQGRDVDAEERLHDALRLASEGNHTVGMIAVERQLGELYEGLGRTDDAVAHYRRAVGADLPAGAEEDAALAAEHLASLAAERGEYREAFEYRGYHHDLRRRLDTRRYDTRMMILRIRYRIDHLESIAIHERDEKEKAHSALQSAHADINALKISLIEHRQRLTTLRSRLLELTRRTREEGDPSAIAALRTLARVADDDGAIGQAGWQVSMSSRHEEFRRRLRERHPELTPALELLCTCVRSGMSTDSIVSTLHITTSAIRKRRHRLRKLLDLRSDQHLEGYLHEI
jgi:tetratricopeptide (TPR) repeat protein